MDKKDMDRISELLNSMKAAEVPTQEETPEGQEQPLTPIGELEMLIQKLAGEVDILEEKRLIAVADSQNTVRRFQNEATLIKKYGGEKLAAEIIGPIDTFRKVLATSPEDPQIKNYLIGFEMIINQIDQGLGQAGVAMIPTKIGDDFSPELHNAIEEVQTDSVAPGKICAIISNGYKLHDRVIKHATVKVAKA
ncbi:hypothetical protein Zmor_012070 [Zophobas morio]|uniref:GrpE protein homolog n=1 Tax=Zophobas morio TaxID=2755281 RepID=A0AA38HGJ8_9CUCU|nr:hypothetical protein Zmor_012070 [Zophobas morio]